MTLALLPPCLVAQAPSFDGGGLLTYAWAFGQGVLVDLTPCVYPLIPITVAVFGAKGVSKARALALASAYVFGMAVLYTTLGVAVASTGAAFGAWLANPWVVLPIVGLLLALAASMFGAFDLALPHALQTRLNTVGGAGPGGAFLMGLVSGLISAPCTGPVLLSLLAYIGQSTAQGSSVLYGASLLFTYALGMGTLFFAVALGASLFRPGPWMEHIKSVFGLALLTMSFWFLRPLSTTLADFILDERLGLWIGLACAALGVIAGSVHRSFHGTTGEWLTKAVAVLITTFGASVTVNNVLYVKLPWHHVETMEEFAAAIGQGDPSRAKLIDFAASWCLPCKELELQGFGNSQVKPLLVERFDLIKVDVSAGTSEQGQLQKGFASETLPSVLIYPSGTDLAEQLAKVRAGNSADEPSARISTVVDGAYLHELLSATP